MEYESELFIKDPTGPTYSPAFDMDEAYIQQELEEHGLCATNSEAARAHKAVFDAEAQRLNASEEETEHILSKRAVNVIIKEAREFCNICGVNDICADFGLRHTKLKYGVMGGMTGPQRARRAKALNIQQASAPRVRGVPKAS